MRLSILARSISISISIAMAASLIAFVPGFVLGAEVDESGEISFAENFVLNEIKSDSQWGVGLMVPVFNGEGVLLERRLSENLWAWGHLTYQPSTVYELTETSTGAFNFSERHRFQLSAGADRNFAIPGYQNWLAVLGAGLGLRRSEVQSTSMKSICRPRCSLYLVSSEVTEAATELAAIGLFRIGVRVRNMYIFGEKTELGVIFERNLETGVTLLSTNQNPSQELREGERSKGSLLLELALKF